VMADSICIPLKRDQSMEQVQVLNVAIVGGGPGCKAIMGMMFAEKLSQLRMKLIGVACTNPGAEGYRYAQEKGLYTTRDYRDLYGLEDLGLIIELTGRDEVANEIGRTKPDHMRLIDHVAARLFWDVFQIEEERLKDRKQAQAALEKAEKEKVTILDNLVEHVIRDDREMKILWANRAACASADLDREELIGRHCYEIWPKRSTPCPDCAVVKAMETGLPQEVQKTTPDGRTWSIKGYPERDERGHIVGGIEVTLDITDSKRLEAQFQEAQRLEAIGTLAGGIAHDFNNLLMGIQGRASLMLMDMDSNHPHSEHLSGIEDAVKRGAHLTKQLLGFARVGKYEVRPADLNDLIGKSSEMLGRAKKEIKIRRKYQKDIWTVEIDRGQIEQVLVNLYVNAWQAMPEGGDLYLETKNVKLDTDDARAFGVAPGHYVKISTTDSGTGMDEATRQRVFEPFFTTKELGVGTGLGLASAYGIIKNHGGVISVDSELGHGTTFDIYLPASEKEIPREKEPPGDVVKGTETVLFVDDEAMIMDVGKEMLTALGYRIIEAKNGKQAVELYEENQDKIDIVILDLIMPDMDGGKVYDRLKKMNPKIKVLLSSGYIRDDRANGIIERGCDGFIQKPFDVKELSGRLREILGTK